MLLHGGTGVSMFEVGTERNIVSAWGEKLGFIGFDRPAELGGCFLS